MPSDNFTMSENSGSFGMQQRQDRFAAIGDLIVGPPGPPGPPGEDAPDDYILVQTTQPTSETNAIWVDPSDQTEVVLATWADVIGLYPTNTASGDVAHFEDGANNIPIKRLTVNVKPIQDLHGYDSPWPAGGGKNLIPTTLEQLKAANTSGTWADNVYSINDLTFTVNADGTITVNGTSSAAVYFNFRRYQDGLTIPAGDYVLHKSGNANINVSAGKNNTYWGAATTSDVSLTLDSDATFSAYSYVANGKTLTNFVLKPMLESGTTASAWQPYSNICPISGRTSATVTRTGVNVWDEVWEPGTLNASTGAEVNSAVTMRSKNFISIKSGETYTPVGPYNVVSTNQFVLCFYDINNTFVFGRVLAKPQPFTVPSNDAIKYMRFAYRYYLNDSGGTYNNDVSINYPASDTQYHSYAGNTYPIPLGTTVYGGTLDVTQGKMVVTHVSADMGELSYVRPSSADVYVFRNNIGAAPVTDNIQHGLTSIYPFAGTRFTAAMPDKSWMIDSAGRFTVRDDSYTDVNAFKTAMTGQTLVYELATPIEITLTPTQIDTLLGTNNIWSDAGSVDVEYRADIGLFIQQKIAELNGG